MTTPWLDVATNTVTATITIWRTEQRHGDLIDCCIRHLGDRGVNAVDILSTVDEVDRNLLIGETGIGADKCRHPTIQTARVRTPIENARVIHGYLLRNRFWACQKVECDLGTANARCEDIEPNHIAAGIRSASKDIEVEGADEALVRTAVICEILRRAEEVGCHLVRRTAAPELTEPSSEPTRIGSAMEEVLIVIGNDVSLTLGAVDERHTDGVRCSTVIKLR